MIIPSIDLMEGKAVLLKQGKEKVLEREDVFELAEYFGRFGEIAVTDVDAAMGKGNNAEIIKKLCKIADCRVGGGVRSVEKAKELLSYGAKKIVIGTKASEYFLSILPKDQVIVAIDSNKGKIVTQGWLKELNVTPAEYISRFDNLCSGYLYTIVEKEGTMTGTDLESVKQIRALTDKEIVASGGISSIDEILELDKINVNCQLGMSIYTGKLDLLEAYCSLLDFNKGEDLIPTVVQDINSKQVLMVVYSNRESIKKSLKTGNASYYSRSKKALRDTSEESEGTQKLIKVKYDCDRDSLLYKVEQTGPACRTNHYSCFEGRDFDLKLLYQILNDKFRQVQEGANSPTKTSQDVMLLKRKINEEAFEIIHAGSKEQLTSEAADLIYYILALMVINEVTVDEVLDMLASRRN